MKSSPPVVKLIDLVQGVRARTVALITDLDDEQLIGAKHPVYWRFTEGKWWRRNFDELVRLEDHLPVLHINWFEADAFCRWVACQPGLNERWRPVPS
jgi:formylglycine-generating enzyme required for sulfatase activity